MVHSGHVVLCEAGKVDYFLSHGTVMLTGYKSTNKQQCSHYMVSLLCTPLAGP